MSVGLKPPTAGGDPVAVAEANGYALYDMEDTDSYVLGSGSGAGRVYQLKDRSVSQHYGTVSSLDGATSGNLPLLTADYFTSLKATAQKFRAVNEIAFPAAMVALYVFRVSDVVNAASAYIFGGNNSFTNRPTFFFDQTGAVNGWTYDSPGGGVNNILTEVETGCIVSAADPLDGGWHCLLLHHGDNASEGLLIELDGEMIADPALITHDDVGAIGSWQGLAAASNISGNNINTNDYRAVSYGPSSNGATHAQSREMASALMAKYGITEL